jgi:hypothetical protein
MPTIVYVTNLNLQPKRPWIMNEIIVMYTQGHE